MKQPCAQTVSDTYDMHWQCRNGGVKHCARCGGRLCQQHFRRRCPLGKRTKYGVTQHAAPGDEEALEKATGLALAAVKLIKRTGGDRDAFQAVLDVRYQGADGSNSAIWLHPGGIWADRDARAWRPDRELADWLNGRLGQEGDPEQGLRWTRPRDCIPLVREAATHRTGENPQAAATHGEIR